MQEIVVSATDNPTPGAVVDAYNAAVALWLWCYRERVVPYWTADLALIDLNRRYLNPTLTNADALRLCEASLAEARCWRERRTA